MKALAFGAKKRRKARKSGKYVKTPQLVVAKTLFTNAGVARWSAQVGPQDHRARQAVEKELRRQWDSGECGVQKQEYETFLKNIL